MAEKLKSKYNNLKSKMTVAKGNMTKALKKLEQGLSNYEKHNQPSKETINQTDITNTIILTNMNTSS